MSRGGLGADRGGPPGRRRGPRPHLGRTGGRGPVLLGGAGVRRPRCIRRSQRSRHQADRPGSAGPPGRERLRWRSDRPDGPGGLDTVHARRTHCSWTADPQRPNKSVSIRRPPVVEILVLDTCTPHALVDSEYAARRASCEEAAQSPRRGGTAGRQRPRCCPRRAAGGDHPTPGTPRRDRERAGPAGCRSAPSRADRRPGPPPRRVTHLDARRLRDHCPDRRSRGRGGPGGRRARSSDDRRRVRRLHHRAGAGGRVGSSRRGHRQAVRPSGFRPAERTSWVGRRPVRAACAEP